MNKKIGIIDYGVGNINSIVNIFKSLNCTVFVSKDKTELNTSDLLILPGVGAFPYAMKKLNDNDLIPFIIEWSNQNKYILGICLGMHLLCNNSFENSKTRGLGIIPGNIVRIKSNKFNIGWSLLQTKNIINTTNVNSKSFFYFNHSYQYEGLLKYQLYESITEPKVPAIINYKNAYGIQFHPEKSQDSGLIFLKKFLQSINNVN